MAKKIDIAGELNAATTEGIVANARQVRLGNDNSTHTVDELGEYTDNPEFIRAYTDVEGKFLWGIRIDGSIEWAKGVPTPIQNALKELADKIKDLGGDKIEEVETALNEKIEALQDAIDVINASLKPLTDTFSFQDNEEFAHVVTDADGKVLFGIKADGKPYFPKNTMYSVESNQEFLAAWLDSAGHVLFGLRTDGSTYVAKVDFIEKIEKIQQLLKDNGIGDDELKQRVEALENNFTNLQDTFNNTFSIISNDEWLHAVVDADNHLLFGIKAENGEVVMPKQDTYKVVSNDEWLAVWLDADNKVLFGVKADGTFWAAKHNFNTGKDYDNQIEQINTTLATMQGTLASVQESVKSLQSTVDDHTTAINSLNRTVSQNSDNIGDLQESINVLQQGNEAMQMLSVIDDEERTEITTDAENKVLSYRDKSGIKHENKGIDAPKYYQNGKEKNFVDKTEIASEVTDAALNGAVKLEDLDGVSNHNTPNLLIASEMQKTFNDGTNSFTPPNEGYEMSNPIECQAGDWFTRTGTATGMVVVTDENDKNGTRLFNADGTTLGNTFQIPEDMTWVRYIRMAAEVGGASDGSIVICKGKVAYTAADRGDYLTVDKLRLQKANIPKDIKYLKSSDGKYWELYVDARHALQIREIDPDIITELPSDFKPWTLTGTFDGKFDRMCIANNRFLIDIKASGVVKYKDIGTITSGSYANFEHFYTKTGEDRYAIIFTSADANNVIGKGFTLFDGEFNILDTNIGLRGYNSSIPDAHDFIYIADDHILLFYGYGKSFNIQGVDKVIVGPIVTELKKSDGVWQVIGEFKAIDYPDLCTDAYGELGAITDTVDDHTNTISIDYDNNLIINCRNWESWIKVKRTINLDGTVTLGSKTHDYNEAIIGRVGGRHNSGYLDSKRVLNDGFSFTDIPQSLAEVSDDAWEEWQWFHCHDVKYWGMKTIGDKQYPTYTLFDNNYWTENAFKSGQYNSLNKNNNAIINPDGAGNYYLTAKDSDENYAQYTHSRVIQLSIDWENHKIMDYRVYYIPKMYSREQSGATMYDEGIISISYSYAGEFGLWDFTTDETEVSGHIYKGAKQLFFGKYDNYWVCYRTNTYKINV